MDIHSKIFLLINDTWPPFALNITGKCKNEAHLSFIGRYMFWAFSFCFFLFKIVFLFETSTFIFIGNFRTFERSCIHHWIWKVSLKINQKHFYYLNKLTEKDYYILNSLIVDTFLHRKRRKYFFLYKSF